MLNTFLEPHKVNICLTCINICLDTHIFNIYFICFSLPSPLAVIVSRSCEQNISKQDINNTQSLERLGPRSFL
mgnify:CR=1 FL=1